MANSENGAVHKESLMDEINALFAPPTGESYGKTGLSGIIPPRRPKKSTDPSNSDLSPIPELMPHVISSTYNLSSNNSDDPYWRKPRPNCHEYCDSCGCTEGDRLVCDRCPASFHLECLDPPMDSDEAPTGVWFCHRCSRFLEDEEDRDSTSSSQSTAATDTGSTRSSRTKRMGGRKRDQSQSINQAGPVSGGQPSQQPSKRSSCISRAVTNERALAGRSSRSAVWGESAYVADTEESELRALWSVIKYAQYQNPKEFDLPKDLLPSIKLPGSYKTVAERKAKAIIDLENGIIPKPVRRCFVCTRTCMFAPLLPCDYCSACFHLECLDPPLPHFPPRSDRWMCPNHIEHIADRYLVRSIRLTERLNVWSQLTNITRDTRKRDVSTTDTAQVVKEEAEHAEEDKESLLPHSNSADAQDTSSGTPTLDVIAPYELTYGPDEEAAILADLMRRVQRGRAEQAVYMNPMINITEALIDGDQPDQVAGQTSRTLWHMNSDSSRLQKAHIDRDQTRIVVPPAVKAMYTRGARRIQRPSECSSLKQPSTGVVKDEKSLFVRGLLEFYLKTDSASLPDGEDDPMTESHEQATTQLTDDNSNEHIITQLDSIGNLFNELPPEKRPNVDFHLILSLAKQRIEDLSAPNRDVSSRKFSHASIFSSEHSKDLRARAVFSPCGNTTGPSVRMNYRKLTIGSAPDCHLRLHDYDLTGCSAGCPAVAAHHATVFYDEWTRHFELLNYGTTGCLVDGIFYGNELTSRRYNSTKHSSMVDDVRSLLQSRNCPPTTKRLKMAACRPANLLNHCCFGYTLEPQNEMDASGDNGDSPGAAAWEGSAILRHGSVVQFGCYQFVVSLVAPDVEGWQAC